MKLFSLVFLTVLLATSANALDEVENFGSNLGNCDMFVYEPASLGKNDPSPLLVAIHGCSETAEKLAKQTGWNELADRHGFRILYPQQKMSNNSSRCWNWFQAEDTYDGQGELGSIREMIDYMQTHYAIKDDGVFVYGVSSGGAMTSALMANYPELFHAGCIYAGGAFGAAESPLRPMKTMTHPEDLSAEELAATVRRQSGTEVVRYPNVVVVHGTRDPIVSPKNGRLACMQWVELHGMGDQHLRSSLIDDREDLVLKEYCAPTGEAIVSHLEIDKLTHQLAIDPGDGERQGGKRTMFSADFDFHSTWWIARQMGLISR